MEIKKAYALKMTVDNNAQRMEDRLIDDYFVFVSKEKPKIEDIEENVVLKKYLRDKRIRLHHPFIIKENPYNRDEKTAKTYDIASCDSVEFSIIEVAFLETLE